MRSMGPGGEPERLGPQPMSAETVALIPGCVECGARWLPTDDERWRTYLTDEDDEPPALAFYCPACAAREFGGD